MRFLIDENLNRAVVRWFISKGHEAEHVEDVLGQAAGDETIAERAVRQGAIIVSKDFDFFDRIDGGQPLTLLWLRTGNLRTRALIERLQADWPRIEQAFSKGQKVVELL